VPPSIGDLDGDGAVGLSCRQRARLNGRLSVLRGDGGDTGDGDR
jgi:hypothetical protein